MGINSPETQIIPEATQNNMTERKAVSGWVLESRTHETPEEKFSVQGENGKDYPITVITDRNGQKEVGLTGWNESFGKISEKEDTTQFARERLNLWLKNYGII